MKPYKTTVYGPVSVHEQAKSAAHGTYKRLKNWRDAVPCTEVVLCGQIRIESFRYKGRYSGYVGHYYFPLYTSYLHVLDERRAEFVLGFKDSLKIKKIQLSRGYEWDYDGSIVQSSDYNYEYHPSSEDLTSRYPVAVMVRKLKENKQKRLEIIRQNQLFLEQIKGTFVTLNDSRRAGNCVEGSLRYAENKLNIPREQILACQWLTGVSTSLLIRTDPNNQAVQRAIHRAWERETLVCI